MEQMEASNTLEQIMIDKAKNTRTPISGSLELLPICNMNCEMCYVRLSREEMEAQGRMRSLDEWVAVGEQMKQAGVLFLLLTGGEPLLYPHFRELYLQLREMGMILTINTNGTLIDEEMAEFFGKYPPRRVNITLYGADETAYRELCHYPGGFEKVVHAVELLREHGVDVKLSSSVTKANEDDIDRMLEIANRLEVPIRMDTYMMPAERERNKPYNMQFRLLPERAAKARVQALEGEMGPELFRQYVEQSIAKVENGTEEKRTEQMSCLAGNCSFTINWQGYMRPCVVMSKPSVSVFDVGFEHAWDAIVKETGQIRINRKCSTCIYRSLCRTCAASAVLETGEYGGVPEYMCRYAEETYRLLKEKKGSYNGKETLC